VERCDINNSPNIMNVIKSIPLFALKSIPLFALMHGPTNLKWSSQVWSSGKAV